ncbi:MAG: Ig-like domain-containing protein [Cyclobacteriaceae bacterium]
MKNLLILLSSTLLVCCGSDNENTPVLASIEIASVAGDLIDLNSSLDLSLEAFDQSGNTLDIDGNVEWSSSNENATVDQNGRVTGQVAGTSEITATVDDISDTYGVTIWDSSAPRTEVYVSDAGSNASPPFKILKFDTNGRNPEVFIDQNLAWPQDIVFLEDKSIVLISNLNSGTITRHDINSGRFIDNFASNISGPTRMKVGVDGLLYVLQWSGNGLVRRYQLDGAFVDHFTDTGVFQSIGMDWDDDGNLYISSFNNGADGFVRKFDTSGNDEGLLINSGLQGPTNIWFDDSGRLMINDWSAGSIRRYDLTTSTLSNVASGLIQPEGVASLPGGNYLIGDGGTSSVKLFNSNNTFVNDFIRSGDGGLLTPNAVVIRVIE